MRIQERVAAKCGENPHHRRGQGSSAMIVSRGLAGPKDILNRDIRKGNALIFVCLCTIMVTALVSSASHIAGS